MVWPWTLSESATMYGGDDLLVGGVDGLEGLTFGSLNEIVVDKPCMYQYPPLFFIGTGSHLQPQRLFIDDTRGLDGRG